MIRARCFLSLILFALVERSAFTATIFDNGTPDKRNGVEMTHWMEADDFVLTNPSRLQSVTFWDFERSGYFAGSFLWRIYSDDGSGRPGTLLFSGTSKNTTHTATGFEAFSGFFEFATTFDIGPISLPRGTYWLALHNGDLDNGMNGTIQDWNFYWESSTGTAGAASHYWVWPYTGSWWSNIPPDVAFQLSGVTGPNAQSVSVNHDTAEIDFTTTAGSSYRVEFKDGLVNSAWTALSGGERVIGTGDIMHIVDTDLENRPRRFYRVSLIYDGPGSPAILLFGLSNDGLHVRFTTAPGYFYRLEYKNELSELSWNAVTGAENITGTGDFFDVTDSDPALTTHPRRFYRAVLQ